MLALSSIYTLLSQVLSLPDLHTAILCTPSGQLVSYTSDPDRAKDDIFVVVGLGTEIWQETHDQRTSRVDSEVGRIVVIPIESTSETPTPALDTKANPLMLLILNSTDAVSWDELSSKGSVLAGHLKQPLERFREHLVPIAQPRSNSATASPNSLGLRR